MSTEDKTKQQEQQSLTDFEWDEKADFFGINDQTEPEDKTEKEEKEEKEENSDKTEEKDEKEPEYTFFEDEKEEEEKKEEKKEEGEEKEEEEEKEEKKQKEEEEESNADDKEFFTVLAEELKDKGIFSYEDEDDIDEEKFFELQDQEVERRSEEKLQALFQGLDEDAVAFIRYKEAGGNTADFFKVLQSSFDIKSIKNLSSEKDQETVVRFQLEKEKWSADEINDRIEWLKDKGNLETKAKQYFEKIVQDDHRARMEALEKEKLIVEQQKQTIKKRNDNVKKAIKNSDVLDQFRLKDREKNDLYTYITNPTVKVGENRYYTQLQKDMTELYNDPEKLLLLSQIVKSDFNFDALRVNLNNKIIKETQSKLKDLNRQKKNLKNTYTSKKGKGNLASFFD